MAIVPITTARGQHTSVNLRIYFELNSADLVQHHDALCAEPAHIQLAGPMQTAVPCKVVEFLECLPESCSCWQLANMTVLCRRYPAAYEKSEMESCLDNSFSC